MKKIRQHNDIDISLLLKNSQGEILNPEQCNKMSVRLRCGGFIVYKTPTVSAGLINIRFNAYEQHRTGEYDITLSAETKDGRTFTTDICKAFCIVPCSCETGGKTDEITIDTIDVCATFDITAWGMTDLEDIDQIREGATKGMTALQEYYDDGSGEVVPVKHPDLSTQPSILPYKFAGNYVYEQMVWLNSSDIEAGMKKVDIPEGIKPESLMVIDITGCAQSSQGCETADVGAAATAEGLFIGVASAISGAKGIWAKIQYCVSPNIENNYYYHQSYIQEEDYIRFLNSLRYAYIITFHYITATGTPSSALTLHSGGEVVLESGALDDFKNNKMYITLNNKDAGSPAYVLLSDGYRKTIWRTRQPLLYSSSFISGALELTKLFDNVERSTLTLEQE